MRSFQERTVGEVKKHEDDANGNGHHKLKPLLGSDFIFKLPAPVVVIAGGHLHFCADGFVGVGDYAAGIPATRIHQNRNFQQAILAVDLGRTGHLTDIRNLSQRDLRAVGSGHEYIRDLSWILSEFRRVAYPHRETPPPFDGGG